MNEQIKEYIDKYPSDIIAMYNDLRNLIFDSISSEPQEMMWAKLPTYYVASKLFISLEYVSLMFQQISSSTHQQEYLVLGKFATFP